MNSMRPVRPALVSQLVGPWYSGPALAVLPRTRIDGAPAPRMVVRSPTTRMRSMKQVAAGRKTVPPPRCATKSRAAWKDGPSSLRPSQTAPKSVTLTSTDAPDRVRSQTTVSKASAEHTRILEDRFTFVASNDLALLRSEEHTSELQSPDHL